MKDGDIFVVKAGPKYELLATNPMGEVLMATPAISDGMIFVRGEHHVFASETVRPRNQKPDNSRTIKTRRVVARRSPKGLKVTQEEQAFMKRRSSAFSGALMLCLLALTAYRAPVSSAVPTNWPQWRGPDSQGISNEKNLPTEWSETKNIHWKTSVPGNSLSSPIIWDKKIFLTSAIEGPALGRRQSRQARRWQR